MELDKLPVIDWELGIKLAGRDKKLAEDILEALIKTLPSELSTIKQLYNDQNHLPLRQQIHKLYGAVCYCGTPRLKTVLAHLETDLKNNIITNLPSLFNQLDIEVGLLLEHYSHLH